MARKISQFVVGSARLMFQGGWAYHAWMTLLTFLVLSGILAYGRQLREGLIVTNMRDQVSWAFYIGNFTFLVGVAAAAVMLVIPAYIYNWKPIKEIAIFGELLAVSAIIMSMLFVFVDVGRPDRVWQLMPIIGTPNLPSSLLGWDVMVLNGYLVLNLLIVVHLLYTGFHGRPYKRNFVVPLLLLSIPAALMAWPRSMGTGRRSTTARPTRCSPATESSSIMNLLAGARPLSPARSPGRQPESSWVCRRNSS